MVLPATVVTRPSGRRQIETQDTCMRRCKEAPSTLGNLTRVGQCQEREETPIMSACHATPGPYSWQRGVSTTELILHLGMAGLRIPKRKGISSFLTNAIELAIPGITFRQCPPDELPPAEGG